MKKLFYLAILSWLLPQATPACAQSLTPAAKTAAMERIIRQAPIVFLGRPLQGHFYKDAWGRIYQSTVLQILEVLRGEARLKPGTVEWVDSLEQSPDLEEQYRFGGTSIFGQEYSIYFAEPSANPAQVVPYQTTNGPLTLMPVNNDRQAQVIVDEGSDGTIIQGLYQGPWTNEKELLAYINGLPRIKPRAQVVNENHYPLLRYHDKRPGGKDLYAPKVQTPAAKDAKKAGAASSPSAVPSGGAVKAKSLPLEAFRELPAVMGRIRAHEPLSKQDSAFIKRYIPDQMPQGPRPSKKNSAPVRKPKKLRGPGLGAQLVAGDTTLVLSVRNLKVPECELAYQGEVWLESNKAGLYMNQLYFEMSTTADLKLDSSPFGQTLIGTYTPLAGAPSYTFYQSYDAATKRIKTHFGGVLPRLEQSATCAAGSRRGAGIFSVPIRGRRASSRQRGAGSNKRDCG